MTVPTPESSISPVESGRTLLSRALSRARLSILWERLWPAFATIATAAGLFLAASWLGLWLALPPLGRAIGVFLFFVLAVAACVPLFLVRVPRAADGLRRLDRNSELPHRPATAIADEMAPEGSDPFSTALWRAHMERSLAAARTLKAGQPLPRLAARDPYAIRALVLIVAVAAFFAAGSDRTRRIAAAFDWQGVVTPANYRIDAWVTPPATVTRSSLVPVARITSVEPAGTDTGAALRTGSPGRWPGRMTGGRPV